MCVWAENQVSILQVSKLQVGFTGGLLLLNQLLDESKCYPI